VKETVFTDHLGSTVQVRQGTPEFAADQRAYTAYGENMEVPNDPIIGRTGYIGRETDKESDLGFYGVRQYDAGYGRFLSTDPLWALYPNLTSFHYAMNNPVTMLDQGGKWVQAMNEGARDAIRTSVPSQFRDAVQFNDNGFLQIESLKEAARGQDVNSNIAILSRLAENEHTIQVSVSEVFAYKDEQGTKQTGSFARMIDGEYVYGQGGFTLEGATLAPSVDKKTLSEHGPLATSANGLLQVQINPNAKEFGSQKTRGQIAAHEMFVHVRLFLMVLAGKASGWTHAPGQSSGAKEHKHIEKAVERAEREARQ